MDRVEQFLCAMLQVERHGGRVKRPNEQTLVFMDISSWGYAQTELLRRHFPCCDVRCEANTASLSGFVIIIERKWQDQTTIWFTIYLSVLLAVGSSLRYLSVTLASVPN